MNAEFNVWLLVVGVVAGAGLAWLVLAELRRREHEISAVELPAEAEWIARTLADQGVNVAPTLAEAVLVAHRAYLGYPPPDALVDPDELRPLADAPPAAAPEAAPVPPARPPDDQRPEEPAS